ncbi:MAG: hypothetical protein J3K34DRAFT_163326 [Monoraphidium minutum]|nr:MAG: hypothetical protein J3K34DRAFT_163326 [Monoraphidium minutum]
MREHHSYASRCLRLRQSVGARARPSCRCHSCARAGACTCSQQIPCALAHVTSISSRAGRLAYTYSSSARPSRLESRLQGIIKGMKHGDLRAREAPRRGRSAGGRQRAPPAGPRRRRPAFPLADKCSTAMARDGAPQVGAVWAAGGSAGGSGHSQGGRGGHNSALSQNGRGRRRTRRGNMTTGQPKTRHNTEKRAVTSRAMPCGAPASPAHAAAGQHAKGVRRGRIGGQR